MTATRISTPDIQAFEKDHEAIVRSIAPECMVLLRNNGTLPMRSISKVALYGSGARHTIKGGTGSGDVNVRHFVTVEEGLENAGIEITTKAWLNAYDKAVDEFKTAFFKPVRKEADESGQNVMLYTMGIHAPEPEYDIDLAAEGDCAIYVLSRDSGEGADRKPVEGDIKLTATEKRDILALNKQFDKFVLVLNVGGMVDLSEVSEVETVLLMGQLGQATGTAFADVLMGAAYPSGKLTMTWSHIEDYPSTEGFGDPNNTDYKEGVYVGYRYFDTTNTTPLFPFGYGLGYTTFSVEPQSVAADAKNVTVEVKVTNTGEAAGKEVVQVYYSAPAGNAGVDKPYQELAGYAKTKELVAGESEVVTVTFSTESMSSYNTAKSAYVLEAGDYVIRAGSSSRNTHVAGVVRLNASTTVAQLHAIGGESGFEDFRPTSEPYTYEGEEAEIAAAPVVELDAATIDATTVEYSVQPQEIPAGETISWNDVVSGAKTIDDFIAGLSQDQLEYVCIGMYKLGAKDLMEVIGNASTTVAGAAGETTHHLDDVDLETLIMADGPAGLRLAQEYALNDKNEARALTANVFGEAKYIYTSEEIEAMKPSRVDENGQEVTAYYQYCTAIPIGTELAQSFNDDIPRICGDFVGAEMEIFGIHLWLAPAMNIYRSPLCGRNFEYFSEDPVVAGRVAGAITRGVQSHKGRAVTIKHFAANNQETNRYFQNNNISERALREIYLKGFEICVKDSNPRTVMTSYNLINQEHACNRHDVVTEALRDEWGFSGFVMTDWLVTGGMGPSGEQWPCASAAGNVKAGNDITMPGMPSDKDDMDTAMVDANHRYPLTKAELQLSAKRVLSMIMELVHA